MRARLLIPLLFALAASSLAQTVDPKLFDGMKWRSIGPFRGGRSLAAAGSVQRPKEYYFGATGGGVWKTTDGGASWRPVSDGFLSSSSVGALAVAPSNPDIVLAGTGERCIRGDVSHGDGLYKSADGGKTWRSIGLRETQNISRIVISPTDPNIIYVAALGRVYGPSPNRGVYKSSDGGLSWSLVLKGADLAGAVDLAMDPANPDVLLAAIWDGWRTASMLNSGGPNSKLYKSVDGGKTWTDLSRSSGMPTGVLGRIGVSISPADPNRYWAIVEAQDGGVFRSDDAGVTWTKINEDRNWRQRAWYYTHIFADPKDRDAVYVLNVGFGKSTDGGKTFRSIFTPHSDNHDLWIAPDDPNRMIESNDGGASVSTDGGKTWTEQSYATGQFYHASTDNAFPYRILGAQQDSGPVRIPSRTRSGGITRSDWTSTAGGESGYVIAKPDDPDVVFGGNYGGELAMLNHRTGESRTVNPWPDNPMGHPAADLEHRFQWTFPIVFSPNDPNILYTGSQYVLKSTNMGQTWTKISPDLTRNDKSKMVSSGGPITKDNTSIEYYGAVFTVAESPRRRGVIWAGSDDGRINVTQNGGRSWNDVTPRSMPKWGLVSMIEPSPFDPAVAYAAVDNHKNDDYRPYAYRTSDYGRTWTPITQGIPSDTYVRVVRADPVRKGLLYAGTETGALISFDDGGSWQPLSLNMPLTPIHDLAWKEGDLIAATHGRGFWILDDVSPLQQLRPGDQASVDRLFTPKDAFRVRWGGGRGFGRGAGATGPSGENPPSGVTISYYLAKDAPNLKLEVRDESGKPFMTVPGAPAAKGFHRVSAFLTYPGSKGAPGMILWTGGGGGRIGAPPGVYTAALSGLTTPMSARFRWLKDPRGGSSDKDLLEQFRFLQNATARFDEANAAVVQVRAVRARLETTVTEAGKKPSGGAAVEAAQVLIQKLATVEQAIYQSKNRSGQDPLNYPIRLNDKLSGLIGTVSNGDFRPTDAAYAVFEKLSAQLEIQLVALKSLLQTDLAALNAKLANIGVAPVTTEILVEQTERGRRVDDDGE